MIASITSNSQAPTSSMIGHPHSKLIELISPLILPLGYRIIDLEIQSHRQKILRIFIDHLESSPAEQEKMGSTSSIEKGKIGIEDCVRVSKALSGETDDPLDGIPELASLLNGAYELEISSPGVNRALRVAGDFEKFAGSKVRIHVFRPLNAEELGNAKYQTANPKQKNFLGILSGFRESKVVLSLSLGEKKSKKENRSVKKTGQKKSDSLPTNSEEELLVKEDFITIPLPLISKANLEPDFDFEGSDERE